MIRITSYNVCYTKLLRSELVGKSDFDFGFEEHARVTYEDEQRIIRTGSPMEDVVEKVV